MTHLLSELTNQKAKINLKNFARDYLSTSSRQSFLNHMVRQGFQSQTIVKNTELIEAQTRKLILEFQDGVTVAGDRESFGKSVKVDRTAEGAARVEITGQLKQVKGK